MAALQGSSVPHTGDTGQGMPWISTVLHTASVKALKNSTEIHSCSQRHLSHIPQQLAHQVPDSIPGVVGEGKNQGEFSRVDESRAKAERFYHGHVVRELLWEQQGGQAEERNSCRDTTGWLWGGQRPQVRFGGKQEGGGSSCSSSWAVGAPCGAGRCGMGAEHGMGGSNAWDGGQNMGWRAARRGMGGRTWDGGQPGMGWGAEHWMGVLHRGQ